MYEQFERTRLLFGREAMEKLAASRVAVFGIGGVGGYVVEALARCGVGAIDLIDNDKVALSNLNRQIIATMDSVGREKTQVMKERILSINPDCKVEVHNCFYLPETRDSFDFSAYDYVVDAVDTVTAKIDLVLSAREAGTPIISSMGTGNKLNPAMFEVADIYKTSVDPLARVMRRELKKRGVKKLKVVYSREEPVKTGEIERLEEIREAEAPKRRSIPASNAFVPPSAGLLIASEVVRDLTGSW
ncbi:MAG: tRNA threonylcarbamoyladenosine dehydratase [Lachnospiraceae bacterium]|nr:tRNA threonylcarbamoyladenosine dehydratase [Lachnospiraceae bacterium]MBQ3972556.1 tRNA threonylcarbamoyladenosine dehydratase [Lachnospiraceae bacterium]MBQ4303089.1 tRNA threonylcarbamoyladenosine dehydratase [Lachnospiraceae bacterium]MBQ5359457.1 tRNA threonylcarbamoyladenosine dehydratase [Lachnospiraceae bacterium]